MTMMGFSITFVVSEVVPLFLITLFTSIAIDLDGALLVSDDLAGAIYRISYKK